ncbi:hypothetical protein FHX15_005378 [Rhizobium sp. BK650]|uniref:hypothetical protein n=1 Tax=Rhizobium sp. BK650 TaxID=2586990 RepID=UPI0016115589|nr:hypothetical protein [Rhizobium sp. BK650]MBB3660109.1 hypothetical protein [Rhizobium sp. BK650]
MRSNREIRKPKKDKTAAGAPAPSGSQIIPMAGNTVSFSKKLKIKSPANVTAKGRATALTIAGPDDELHAPANRQTSCFRAPSVAAGSNAEKLMKLRKGMTLRKRELRDTERIVREAARVHASPSEIRRTTS